MGELVVCETAAAIVPHLREVTKEAPVSYSGFTTRPSALCGAVVAWDTKLPISAARCRACIAIAK